ncbi:MAG: outer membrane protein assembly factor BamD [Gemmatimonadales bacterium]|nr:outer membrane protein assembly factor BamD [Gemmatimonadales bacterium]MDQ3427173.1 outer membrane protein assembly factor BamD [Gemmatimonadota bacterium]
MNRRDLWSTLLFLPLAAGLSGCAGSPDPEAAPAPATRTSEGASAAQIDSLWRQGESDVRRGKWADAVEQLERALLEFSPGDPRTPRAHYYLGEAQYALGSHLQAAREFRKVSDETPNEPLAPEALLRVGDVYADLWRRPELDPSYGQTALAAYQELVNRYPGGSAATRAQQRINELQERFAVKEYKAALYYFRLKAYDSAILYLKDLVATYPRSSVAPDALIRLVQAYRTLGYREDVQETCGYIRQFHPRAAGVGEACPTNTAEAS